MAILSNVEPAGKLVLLALVIIFVIGLYVVAVPQDLQDWIGEVFQTGWRKIRGQQ